MKRFLSLRARSVTFWIVRKGPVTLLFDAHDAQHSNAVVLRAYLQDPLVIRVTGSWSMMTLSTDSMPS